MPDQRVKCDRKIIPRVYKVSASANQVLSYNKFSSHNMTNTTDQNSYAYNLHQICHGLFCP